MTKKQMGLVGNMLAILLMLCFIFGNSLLSGEESGEMSASVRDVLIDFSGAFTGILLLWLITELTQKDKR